MNNTEIRISNNFLRKSLLLNKFLLFCLISFLRLHERSLESLNNNNDSAIIKVCMYVCIDIGAGEYFRQKGMENAMVI